MLALIFIGCFKLVFASIGGVNLEAAPAHAIYLSTAKISIEEQQVTTSIHVFIDDLQNSIRNFSPDEYELCNEEQFVERHQKLITQYFNQHFQMLPQMDGSRQTEAIAQQYISGNIEGEVYVLKFGCPWEGTVQAIQIKADYFMELFPTQSNVIQFTAGKLKRFGRLRKGDEDLVLQL